jgi:5-methylthioadenosine/S-adenosylhomocysteine deaminase
MKQTLIENGIVISINENADIFDPGYVLLEGDRILTVAAGSPPPEVRERADQILNARNMAVMPGIVNGHTHLFQSFIRGLADDKPLLDWLRTAIWPVAQEISGRRGLSRWVGRNA